MLTRQQIYDKVKERAQDKRKSGYFFQNNENHAEFACTYRDRDTDTAGCFFGIFIDDEDYYPELEENSASNILINNPEIAKKIVGHKFNKTSAYGYSQTNPYFRQLEFFTSLQRIHDHAEPENWDEELAYFAKQKGLNP